jgi:membrane associated rhomboid family serine protease
MRSAVDFGFPPFTRAVKFLVYVNVAIFLLFLVLNQGAPAWADQLLFLFGLQPVAVLHGWVWQPLTYAFLHAGVGHVLFNMLSLWMFGSRLEVDWGRQRFLEFFFFSSVGAALVTIAVAYTHVLGMSPQAITVGASGGIYGLIVAFGILYSRMRIYVFGIFPLEARVFAAIWVGLALLSALGARGDVNNIAHLGGAIFGYIYLRFMPRRGVKYGASESYYGVLNRYHRWKQRRAAKKFEVFMRQHDRSQYFDEFGNFRDPAARDRDKEDGKADGKGEGGGWVN